MLITQLRISPLLKIFFIISWRPFTRKGLWFESPYLRLSAPLLCSLLLIFCLLVCKNLAWLLSICSFNFFTILLLAWRIFVFLLSGSRDTLFVQWVIFDFFCFVLFFMHTYTSIDQFHTQSNYIWHSFLAAKKKRSRSNRCMTQRRRITQY